MEPFEIEKIEVDLLLEAIYARYGYDFRCYARASIERRLRQFAEQEGHHRLSALIPLVLYEQLPISRLIQQLSVPVTEMFRDPFVYSVLRSQVIPLLQTFPFIKVWAAGCATGEEVYSLAILLHEAKLLGRSTVYGTDFNDASLQTAKLGVYSPLRIQEFTRNYQESGGSRSFADYYQTGGGSATLKAQLKERVTFANHNLATDQVFGEMQLIVCRNVLIYFNRKLKNRALQLFASSLVRGGFLVIGTKEDLQFSEVADQFEEVNRQARIYRKVSS